MYNTEISNQMCQKNHKKNPESFQEKKKKKIKENHVEADADVLLL